MMSKHLLSAICLLMLPLVAHAEDEIRYYNQCENAIYVDTTFSIEVDSLTCYYFTANTYDLPVTVYFFPKRLSEADPEVYVDFSCVSGEYSDPNVENLVANAAASGIHFPMMPKLETIVSEDGIPGYRLSYNRDILDMLAAYNIDYSIPVMVQMISPCAGTARIDNLYTTHNCEDRAILWDRMDTIHILAKDSTTAYRIPIQEWFISGNGLSVYWSGTTAPIAYIMSDDCVLDTVAENYIDRWRFESTDEESGYYVQDISPDVMDIYARSGKNLYVQFLSSEKGNVYVDDYKDHTITLSTCTGNRKTTLIDFPSATEGIAITTAVVTSATKSYRFKAEDIQGKNIRFSWKTDNHMPSGAFIGRFCGFELDINDADVLDTVEFHYHAEDDMMYGYLPQVRVDKIVEKNAEGWLFLQVGRHEAGTFRWDEYTPLVLDCDQTSTQITADTTLRIPALNHETAYKINESDFLDSYQHTFRWVGTKQTYFWISDTCSYPYAPNNPHVKSRNTIQKNSTLSFTAEELEELFDNYADGFGNLYIRMRSGSEGQLVVRTIVPDIPSGMLEATIGERTSRLIMRGNSVYIEVTEVDQVTLYDLLGHKVE